jgi:hypothetical protein
MIILFLDYIIINTNNDYLDNIEYKIINRIDALTYRYG